MFNPPLTTKLIFNCNFNKTPTTTTSRGLTITKAGNFDVENLSQNLYEIWIRLCSELHANSNELRGTVELEQVFGRAGISMRVAEPLAEEIFEKLRLDAEKSTINFQQFIGLIQTEDNVMYFANNCTKGTNTNRTNMVESGGEEEDETESKIGLEKGRKLII